MIPPRGSADAVWAAHCIEHLVAHQVPDAKVLLRRRPTALELTAVARAPAAKDAPDSPALMTALEL